MNAAPVTKSSTLGYARAPEPFAELPDARTAERDHQRFLTGPGLLVFLAAALAAYEAFLLFTVFGPTQGGWLGDFVRDFQLWCYRGDPRTGGVSWAAVSVMFLEPIFVVVVAAVLWRQACVELCRPRVWWRHARAAAAGITVVAVAVAGLFWYAAAERARAGVLPPFPGDRIRVKLPVPATEIIDQKEKPFRFADLRGQVVLVTGVYASCTTSCPEIFLELKAILGELTPAERTGLRVVALTLNPEYETAALMDAISEARGFVYPEFRYAGAARPAVQHALLSDLQFAAVRNPVTRQIDHANLLLLLDRNGDIAFRFNLDPRHRAWLRAALRQLLQEPHGAPGPS